MRSAYTFRMFGENLLLWLMVIGRFTKSLTLTPSLSLSCAKSHYLSPSLLLSHSSSLTYANTATELALMKYLVLNPIRDATSEYILQVCLCAYVRARVSIMCMVCARL